MLAVNDFRNNQYVPVLVQIPKRGRQIISHRHAIDQHFVQNGSILAQSKGNPFVSLILPIPEVDLYIQRPVQPIQDDEKVLVDQISLCESSHFDCTKV
jgi:hypothetical protein